MEMRVINDKISRDEIRAIAKDQYVDLVKAVVDVNLGLLAIGGEFHSDMETLLVEREGSKREHVWGVNLYPDKAGTDFIEFDSLINLKPSHGNRSRNVEDKKIRSETAAIVHKFVTN